MKQITIEELLTLTVCESTVTGISIDRQIPEITILIEGEQPTTIQLEGGELTLMRIKGYEVLDQDEEVAFDMPDIEILGTEIESALATLLASAPHAVAFGYADGSIIFSVNDDTDSYELVIKADAIFMD